MNKELLQIFTDRLNELHSTLSEFIFSQPDKIIDNYCISVEDFGPAYIQELKGGSLIDSDGYSCSTLNISERELINFIKYNLI